VKDNCVSYARRLSDWVPADAFIKKLAASPVVSAAADLERARTERKLAKTTDGKKTARVSIPKLVDAIHAGTARSRECTLILTEGDSAKAFAVAGLAVLGHDKYGVFPLKGKLLNTREASAKQVTENAEIKALKTILGLQHNNAHPNREGLRYGNVLILTDADADGSHIKGLFLNFLHTTWPALAKSGFVRTLPTPLVKATRGAQSQVRPRLVSVAFLAPSELRFFGLPVGLPVRRPARWPARSAACRLACPSRRSSACRSSTPG
jgi:DNA topoisomerase-2